MSDKEEVEIHEKVKGENYDYLTKAFGKTNLKNDKKLGQKIYKCDSCDQTFGWRYNLNTHVKAVHENVTYKCDSCEKTFACKIYMKKHLKAVQIISDLLNVAHVTKPLDMSAI